MGPRLRARKGFSNWARCLADIQPSQWHTFLGVAPFCIAALVIGGGEARARDNSASQLRSAWYRFHYAYGQERPVRLCALLAPTAQGDIEAQTGRSHCQAAAIAWFGGSQYDRRSALHARLVSIRIDRYRAETLTSDPNSPADTWTWRSAQWQISSFFVLG